MDTFDYSYDLYIRNKKGNLVAFAKSFRTMEEAESYAKDQSGKYSGCVLQVIQVARRTIKKWRI